MSTDSNEISTGVRLTGLVMYSERQAAICAEVTAAFSSEMAGHVVYGPWSIDRGGPLDQSKR